MGCLPVAAEGVGAGIRRGAGVARVHLAMACLGCGAVSQNRLCCPECIKYGRTSFFCGQECFTKNWRSHSQLHEALRKKQAEGESAAAGAAASANAGASGDGLDSRSASSQSVASRATTQPRRGPAPLPGGMPLASSRRSPYPSGSESAAAKKDGLIGSASAGQLGRLGGLVGRAWAIFGSAATGAISGAASGSSIADDSRRSNLRGRSRGRSRSRSPAAAERLASGRLGAAAAMAGRRARVVPKSVAVLALVGMISIGLLYSVHERHLEYQRRDQIGLEADVEIMPPVPETPRVIVDESKVPEGQAHSAAMGNTEPKLDSIHSQIMQLRQDLDRHEKMLRYVMERYVEKEAGKKAPPAQGAKVLEAHRAGEVNFSAPEFVRTGEIEAAVASEARQRRGKGDYTIKRKESLQPVPGGRHEKVGVPRPEASPADSDSSGTDITAADSSRAGNEAAIGRADKASSSDTMQLRDDSNPNNLILG